MTRILFLLSLLLIAALVPMASAQFDIVDPDHVVIEARGWDISVVKYTDVFPKVDNMSEGGQLPWLRFLVEYTVTIDPERAQRYSNPQQLWLDTLELQWTVILAPEKRGDRHDDRRAVRLHKTVTYANVDINQRRYYAVIYLEPRVWKRYASTIAGDDMFAHVRFRVGRKTRGEMAARGKQFSSDSREMRNLMPSYLFQSEVIHRPVLGLLNRYETPWEWSSYDSFETIIRNQD